MKLVFTQFFLGVFLIINAVSSCSSKSAPQKLAVTTTSTTTKPLPRPHSSYDTVNLQPVVATGNSNAEDGVWKPSREEEDEGDRPRSTDSSSSSSTKKHQQQLSASPANGHNEELLLKSVPTEISKRLGGSTGDDDENYSTSALLPSSSFLDANSQHNQHTNQFHKSHKPLTLVHFANKSVQCNDKTTAGYYVRNSHVRNSNTWIIFLEGGWFCFDERSCQNRWLRLKNLMSSSAWPHHKHVGGILSGDPNENPYWWSANHVFVPYCSSDTWSGTTKADENGSKFSFMGALIIEEVIKTLIRNGGIRSDSTVILAGSSAGGTGVLINLDRVEELMHEQFDYVDSGPPRVKGISDSGWFIDKLPSYSEKVDCHDVILCPPHISLKKGMHLWNSRLPERCQNSYPDEPWSCFFGYRIYPTLKASSFIFQWMFDEAQMLVNNVPTPVLKKEEWDYVYKVGDELKKTLINVTNVFIPACMAHTVLTHRDWKRVEVNSVYLPRALKCWESGGIVGESNSIQSSHASYQSGWDDDDEEESSSLSHRRNPRLGNRISLQHSTPTEQSDFLDVNSNDSRRNRRRHNRHRQAQMTKRERRKHRKKMEQERIAAEKASQANNNKRRNVANDFHVANSDTLSTKTRLRQRRRHQDNKPTTNSQQQSDEPLRGRSVNNNNHINSRTNSNTKSSNNSNNNGRVPRKNNNNSNNHHHRSSNSNSLDVTNNFTNNHLRNNNRNNNNKKKNRKRRWYSVCDAGDSSVGGAGGDIRLIENRCSFPQCNKSCPKLLNPLTGEEVDFKDLLKSFGLDMATMAKALGIDLATLNNMDHQVLLQMLTQHA